jgi:hypothetical protein
MDHFIPQTKHTQCSIIEQYLLVRDNHQLHQVDTPSSKPLPCAYVSTRFAQPSYNTFRERKGLLGSHDLKFIY